MDLTQEQWDVIAQHLPSDPVREDRRGRPWSDRRQVINGVLWILRTGAPWKDLPARYGAYQTVHRRFQNWVRSGVLEAVLLALAQDLKERGGLDVSVCFIDGTFVPAKKRGRYVGKTKRGNGTKIMGIAERHGLPLAVCAASASPAEVKLVAQTVDERFVAEVPERLIGDKAYDSDGLDEQMLREYGTEVIAPHRCHRRRENVTQDGRVLRRYARRWKIERLFA